MVKVTQFDEDETQVFGLGLIGSMVLFRVVDQGAREHTHDQRESFIERYHI
jgi:hypothetical protein